MLTPEEITTMRTRKNAGKGALRFFKKIAPVKSANSISCYMGCNLNVLMCWQLRQQRIIDDYRGEGWTSIMDSFSDAIRTGLGNCQEKASICYAGLADNPALINNSVVTLCAVENNDHVIVLLSDAALVAKSSVRIRDLGKTAMVVDGWTHDWYFPNLDILSAFSNHLDNIPTPRQFSIRYGVMHHTIATVITNNFT